MIVDSDMVLLTVPQAAQAMKITTRAVRKMVRDGVLGSLERTVTSDGRMYLYIPAQAIRDLCHKIRKSKCDTTQQGLQTIPTQEQMGTLTLDELFGKQKSPRRAGFGR